MEAGTERSLRADAERNRSRLIAAGHEAFTEIGPKAPLEEIARRAGVGIGTLYRHFPNRAALLEAVYVEEVATLCQSASRFADASEWDALAHWLLHLVTYLLDRPALAQEVTIVASEDTITFRACYDAIFTAGEPLFERAKVTNAIRQDIAFSDVVQLVRAVTMIRNTPSDEIRRILTFALDGLRYQQSPC